MNIKNLFLSLMHSQYRQNFQIRVLLNLYFKLKILILHQHLVFINNLKTTMNLHLNSLHHYNIFQKHPMFYIIFFQFKKFQLHRAKSKRNYQPFRIIYINTNSFVITQLINNDKMQIFFNETKFEKFSFWIRILLWTRFSLFRFATIWNCSRLCLLKLELSLLKIQQLLINNYYLSARPVPQKHYQVRLC